MVGERRVRARPSFRLRRSHGVQRRARLGLPGQFLHTAQRELPAGTLHEVEMHFGRDIAPGGSAWAVPVTRPEGPHVRVGVMVFPRRTRLLPQDAGAHGGVMGRPPTAQPRLKILPLAAIAKTYDTRLLAVGDAAGLVKPTTGGGIYYSVLSGSLAADVGSRALRKNAPMPRRCRYTRPDGGRGWRGNSMPSSSCGGSPWDERL